MRFYTLYMCCFMLTSVGCQSLQPNDMGDSSLKNTAAMAEQASTVDADKTGLLLALTKVSGLHFAQSDEANVQYALENNFTHQGSVWLDAINKLSLSVTPTRTFELANKQYCREYRLNLSRVDGELTSTAVACRQANGVWAIK